MTKWMSHLGWILFGVVFIALIVVSFVVIPKSKTVDFRGYVDEVNDNGDFFYIKATGIFDDAPTTIKVKKNIKIRDINGSKKNISEIKKGDMIDLDFKGELNSPEDILTAKWINIYPSE